ncbi:MAG TPA: DUF748 domain-containing protein [Candidatus Binatia bacterium]
MIFLRRYRFALGALVIAVASCVSLPWLARPALERALSARLHMPVTIGQLSWNPFIGVVTARRISIGRESDRFSAARLSVDVGLYRLLRGDVVLDRVDVDAPVGTVRLDADYQPRLGGLGGEGAARWTPPAVAVRELVVSKGELTVRYPVRGQTRDAKLAITRLVATDLQEATGGSELGLSVHAEGALDGTPVRANARLHVAGDATQIDAQIAVPGLAVNPDVIPLPQGLERFSGTLDVHATYAARNAPPGQTLRLDVSVGNARIVGDAGTEFSAKRISIPGIRVDLARRRVDLGAVTLDAPVLIVALVEEGVVLPLRIGGGTAASSWTVRSGAIELRGGNVSVRRGETALTLALESARWDGIDRGHATPVAVRANVGGGGALTIDGALGADPLDAECVVKFEGLALPPWTELAAVLPLRLAKGTGDGTLRIRYRDGAPRLDGKLLLRDVHTAPPDPDRSAEVLAVHAAEVEFAIDVSASREVDVSSLKLSYPYVMVLRRPSGTFPYAVFSGSGQERSTASAKAAPREAGHRVRFGRVEVDGGKVEYMDTTLESAYWTILTDVTAQAGEILLPEATFGRFTVAGKQDELSPVEASGSFTTRGLQARADLKDVLLESLNPYVSPLLGYKVTSGRLSLSAEVEPAPPLLGATAEIVLSGVDVLQTGLDVIQDQSGVPLPIALGLIKNVSGEIELTLPVAVDTRARSVALGSIFGQAVRSAIVGALTSPLRILGSLFGTRGAPHAFAITPIPFPVGSASLEQAGSDRVAQIARIVQAHQDLALVLLPQITEEDIRAVGADGGDTLANQRTAAVREALVGTGLAAARLMMAPWRPLVRAEATGKPGVYVELQAAW